MKEIKTLTELYKKEHEIPAALATVIHVEGSSYRRVGARMLIYENGKWKGGISGGCLEKDVLKNAKLVMLEQKARTIRYDTGADSPDNIGVGLGCNGVIDILISPLKKDNSQNPLEVLSKCVSERSNNLLISVVKNESLLNLDGGDMFRFESVEQLSSVLKNRDLFKKIASDIKTVIKNGKTQIVDYQLNSEEKISFLFEVLLPNIHLVIVGNNYDIYPISDLANVLGWKITAVANPMKLDKSIFKIAEILPAGNEQSQPLEADPNTALILMSHDYETDLKNLKTYLSSDAGYIGILGPRKRGDKIISELKSAGNFGTEEQYARVFTPTGLDIGANTPEEIALSILAEIRSFFSGRTGGSLIEREGSIH